MHRPWIALALAAALVAACGPSEEQLKQQQAQARQQDWTAIEAAKKSVDAKRAEVASLKAQAATGVDVAGALAAADAEVTRLGNDLSQRLAAYINADPPVAGEPLKPEQLAAVRMNSAEGMFVAREYIELGGDYRRALDIYGQLLQADPDNSDLKAAISDAQAKRFMTAPRFETVKKGMSMDEVVAALGRPLARNIKDYPEKKVTAWFYPKDEEGDAAGVFFTEKSGKSIVYQVNFEAVKAKSGAEEAPES
jgi:hypothetical protein